MRNCCSKATWFVFGAPLEADAAGKCVFLFRNKSARIHWGIFRNGTSPQIKRPFVSLCIQIPLRFVRSALRVQIHPGALVVLLRFSKRGRGSREAAREWAGERVRSMKFEGARSPVPANRERSAIGIQYKDRSLTCALSEDHEMPKETRHVL